MGQYFNRVIVRVYILDPAALATSSQALCVFLALWRRGAGHVTIVLANLLEPGMVRCWVGRRFDSQRSHASLWYSQTRLQGLGEEASARVRYGLSFKRPSLLGTPNIWCDSWCADPLRQRSRTNAQRGGQL